MEEFRRLTASRRAHRGQMTKLMNRAEDMSNDIQPMATMAEKQQLFVILDSCGAKLQYLRDLDQKIMDKTQLDDLEEAIIASDDYLENLNGKIRTLNLVVSDNQSNVRTHNDSTLNSSQNQAKRKVNLPKLELPKFDGNILKWMTFFDAFSAAVHNDENLDDIQKFQYLRSYNRWISINKRQLYRGISTITGSLWSAT